MKKISSGRKILYRSQGEPESSIKSWRVAARELKSFVRDMAQKHPEAYIGIYATVMPLAKGKPLPRIGGPQTVAGGTRRVARGIYQALTGLHQRGFAYNDLKRDNIVYDEETGGVALIDTGAMHKYSTGRPKFQQSTHIRGANGYMSPRVAQGEPHGPETDYYSFACLLLTTTEPDFESALTRIFAQEYGGEWRGGRVAVRKILKDRRPEDYLRIMIDAGKNDHDPETREAALRLESKLNSHPDFKRAVEDSFIASSGQGLEADQARQRLSTNPYMQYPS